MRRDTDIFDEMIERWPSAIVSRTSLEAFTGGLVNGKYLANLASLGLGPPQIKCGKKVGYPVKSLADWMRNRSTEVKKK